MLGIIIGIIILIAVGWAIVKGKYAPLVLFASGVFMLVCSAILKTGKFMPKKAMPTGNEYLDIIEYIRYMFSNTMAELGLLIMFMVGFANYMTHIGANDAFVSMTTKRLTKIKNPYFMIFAAFAIAKLISMVITSAAGLGVLCLALLGPVLISLGLNKMTIGSICCMSGAASMVLIGASTAAAAKATQLSILDYVFTYKIPAALPTSIVIGIALVFWNKYLDKKEGWICSEHIGESLDFSENVKRPDESAPKIYAILPFLPMILVVVFSEYCLASIKLNISAIILLSVIIAIFCEIIRYKFKFNPIADGLKAFFQAMGKSLSGVVVLIVAAGVFAQGFKALGMLDSIVSLANTLGFGGLGMSILFVIITTLVTIIAGSNGASFYPLIEMVPHIASKLNVSSVMLVLPMHQASTIARPLSPVSGVVVAIAGMLKCSPLELVKRCSVPAVAGLVSHHIFVFLLSL
ncbi:C4-dicarboxylate transporter DcuC [Campylobacter sp. faydin G-24]|uniref:C4-dicarboxylate transporter DcuC n=1 Tax=Campylobacter anatolicus TaxID=2829105 RepID=A0ABS5HGU1_9BACT|nr:C4-dicarboxylate transporter DcuC [Campylobacter anatolicus]MBR8461759.1 C4-dicarboxylate transporter DcuC [Campylobacter anatolicus]MBR8463494.1 C4-dicarboxylate transporter DcuC [Campylobacter anatolicus]MBR8465153.1 C4-dicarboxylate transporter DcuC [Campylobacter anatolicus]